MIKRTAWITGIVIGLVVLLALSGLFMMGTLFGGYGGMMGGRGMMGGFYGFMQPFGWAGMLLGGLVPLGLLALLVVGGVWLVRSLSRSNVPPANTAASRFCPNCGKPAQSEWKNCPYCGQTLP